MRSNTGSAPAEHTRLRKLLKDVTLAIESAGHDHPLVKQLRHALSESVGAGYDPTFPWAPLSYEWWQRAGQRVGASVQQLRFAAHWASTGNAAAAARFAGLGGDHPKQAGHVALRGVAVCK